MQTSNDAVNIDPEDAAKLGHPRGLSTLFFTELWERFSYYGMKAFLLLFISASVEKGGLGFDKATSGELLAIYFSVAYLTGLPGGWVADKLLGQRRAVFWGGVIIMFGHISLAFHSLNMFFLGLGLIILGTGLLKTNVSAMVGQLYPKGDPRRDAGYSIYYMGINLGAFVGPLITGWLAQSDAFKKMLTGWGMDPNMSWHWGFGAAAVGMFAGLIQFVLGTKRFGDAGMPPTHSDSKEVTKNWLIFIGSLLLIVAISGILWFGYNQGWFDPPANADGAKQLQKLAAGSEAKVAKSPEAFKNFIEFVSNALGITLIGLAVMGFGYFFVSTDYSSDEKKKIGALACLFLVSVIFFSGLEQSSSVLNNFADKKTDCSVFGYTFPSTWFQSANPLYVIIFAPVFAAIWVRLGNRQPSSPGKFAISMFILSIAYLIMTLAAKLSGEGESAVRVGPFWLASVFLFITLAELCISPIGLSLVTKLAPERSVGLVMGIWWIGNATAGYVAGKALVMTEKFPEQTIYMATAVCAFIAGCILAVMVKPIKKMMGGVT